MRNRKIVENLRADEILTGIRNFAAFKEFSAPKENFLIGSLEKIPKQPMIHDKVIGFFDGSS